MHHPISYLRKGLCLLALSPIAFSAPTLVFSVDLVRHGDRTPVTGIPKSPHHWKDGFGELTQEGKAQEKKLGQKLRTLYVSQKKLLPGKLEQDHLYVRASYKKRTQDSARSILAGLYPPDTRAKATDIITVEAPAKNADDLLLVKPTNNPLTMLNLYHREKKAWSDLTVGLEKKLEEWREATGMKLDGLRSISLLADNLRIREIKNIPFPKGISRQDAKTIIDIGNKAFILRYKEEGISYNTGHNFLQKVKSYFYNERHIEQPLKYALFSGHDSTIMAVMNTLGKPLDEIPQYASRLNFALYEENDEYDVVVKYNDKIVKLDGCKAERCTIQEFDHIANS